MKLRARAMFMAQPVFKVSPRASRPQANVIATMLKAIVKGPPTNKKFHQASGSNSKEMRERRWQVR